MAANIIGQQKTISPPNTYLQKLMIDGVEVPLGSAKGAWHLAEFESFKLFYFRRKILGVEPFVDVLI